MNDQKKLDMDIILDTIDKYIVDSEVQMEIRIPSGSNDAQTRLNIFGGPTMEFYVLLAAMPAVFERMNNALKLDDSKLDELLDEMLAMVKDEILDRVQHKE